MFDESLLYLRREIQELLKGDLRVFILDLADVPHCDSSGTGEVIGVYTSITKAGGVMAVAGLTERVRVLWSRVKLLEVFNIFETVPEAELFVRQPR